MTSASDINTLFKLLVKIKIKTSNITCQKSLVHNFQKCRNWQDGCQGQNIVSCLNKIVRKKIVSFNSIVWNNKIADFSKVAGKVRCTGYYYNVRNKVEVEKQVQKTIDATKG